MLVVPGYRFLLRPGAGLQVDAVMLDVGNCNELFDPLRTLVCENGVVPVVVELFVAGDDEQHRAILDATDVLDRRVLHQLLPNGLADHPPELRSWSRVTDLASRAGGPLGESVLSSFRSLHRPSGIHRADLTDKNFDAGISRRHVNDVAA